MQIYGVDFTSAPSSKKPITCFAARYHQQSLYLQGLESFTNFTQFETMLQREGPWVGAFDFPFGQPEELLQNLQWPLAWSEYVAHIGTLSQAFFEETLLTYQANRPYGAKQHFRLTDRLTQSSSPMKLHYPPVGKMFFKGAPRLLQAGVSVLPCHPTSKPQIALEGYPALIARRCAIKGSYKTEQKIKDTVERQQNRQKMLTYLSSPQLQKDFGFTIDWQAFEPMRLVEDFTGDSLDALFCAIQAAWAYTQKDNQYGISSRCNPNEGWIIDPLLS